MLPTHRVLRFWLSCGQIYHALVCFYVWYCAADASFDDLYMFGTAVFTTLIFVVTFRAAAAYGEWTWIT